LSYALYGTALSNIRKDNLVNKTNGKNMLVSLDFGVGGKNYKIERGRKPNVLRFFVNDQEQAITDNAQGDSRETQDNIEQLLGLSHDMFRHILALNTYTEPFLSLKANEQRTIIEQLLGITQLSDRADRIKELNKQTKDSIQQEEFRIRAEQEANKRIEEQIESLKRRQTLWTTKHGEDLRELEKALKALQNIEIETEIQAHKDHKEWDQRRKDINELSTQISRVKMDIGREDKLAAKLSKEIETLENHECHTCGQAFHDNKHQQVLDSKQTELATAQQNGQEFSTLLFELQTAHDSLGPLGRPPAMFYDRETDAIQHQATVAKV